MRRTIKKILIIWIITIMLGTILSQCRIVESFGTMEVQAASYSSDYKYWSQGASDDGGMRKYGCWVVAQSKMLYELGIDQSTSFNPDVYLQWQKENGYIDSGYYQTNGAQAPVAYATQQGKKLNYLGYWDASDEQLWFNINAGYYTILCVNGGGHYVLIANELSKSKGELYCYDSYSSHASASPRSISNYSVKNGGYVYLPESSNPNDGNTTSNVFSSSGTVSEITDTSAKISAKLNGTYNVSTCGFDIGLSPEAMDRVTENANTKVNSMWYSLGNGSKWYGTLKPGTTYYYRFFAIINGVEHVGTVQSFTTSTRIPQGNVDSITGGSGCFNISGWAFDRDDLSKALEIHVYLGNENAPEELCAVIEANKYRQDVNDVYPDVGVNHGFEQTITTNRTGNQTIYVYAINVGSGNENPLLGKQTITIAKDIEAPIITNAYISESTNEKFTIIINANDNCGIEDVWLDLTNAKTNVATILNKATKIGEGIYSYTLDESTANNLLKGYEGKYTISIEAIDKEWNYSKEYKLEHVVDLTSPTISNVQVTDVSETGYTVTCTVVDDVRLNRVQFPTWTAANGQDDLAQDWWNNTSITGKINGAQVSFRVNAGDHNNETGVYRTHIYAIDSCGNSVCYEIPDIIVKQNNPFNDVQEGRFFYDPVLWAVKNNITTGTSPVTFSPDDPCTRAQVVTFIWRAINRPEASNKSAFEDLREGAYYLDAVDWAVENKITTGTSPNTFSPDEACTRAQIVTFLWRVAGCPKPSKESAFEDLREGAYYLDAVSWAVEEGITVGTSPTKFSPDEKCTRAQVVTFLYRYIY